MIHRILVSDVNADLPTSNLQRGNVQAVVIGQQQTPPSTLFGVLTFLVRDGTAYLPRTFATSQA